MRLTQEQARQAVNDLIDLTGLRSRFPFEIAVSAYGQVQETADGTVIVECVISVEPDVLEKIR